MSASASAAGPGPAPDSGPGPRVAPRQDPRLHWAVTLAVIVSAVVTVRPLGVDGRGLAVAALIAVNAVALHAGPAHPCR
ncbi:hypothetical protein ACWGCI_20815 [Streptomyces sp. NPDC054949]